MTNPKPEILAISVQQLSFNLKKGFTYNYARESGMQLLHATKCVPLSHAIPDIKLGLFW